MKLETIYSKMPIGKLVPDKGGKMKFVANKNEWLNLVTAAIISPSQYIHCEEDDRPYTLKEIISYIQKGEIQLW